MDAAGHALAGLEQPIDGHLGAFGVGGVWRRDLPDGLRVEWAEVERTIGAGGRERLARSPLASASTGMRRDDARQLGELAKHPLVGLIRIIDDQQRRACCLACAAQRGQGGVGGTGPGRVQHRGPEAMGVAGQLGGQPASADPVRGRSS